MNLVNTKYHFVFVQNRKRHDIVLDFQPSDFRHATGLHHITDIAIEKNPMKLINAILYTVPSKISDRKLEKSKKYKAVSPYSGSVRERISDMRFLEQCLDTSDFMRIYQTQPFGSQIGAEYFIEAYCSEIQQNVYIFIRKRQESDQYVMVSFFRKKATLVRPIYSSSTPYLPTPATARAIRQLSTTRTANITGTQRTSRLHGSQATQRLHQLLPKVKLLQRKKVLQQSTQR